MAESARAITDEDWLHVLREIQRFCDKENIGLTEISFGLSAMFVCSLIKGAVESNAGTLELTITDAKVGGKPAGDWYVLVRRAEANDGR